VRVLDETPTSLTCVPVKGHPLTGAMTMEASERPSGLMFRIVTYTTPASTADAALMQAGGSGVQSATWMTALRNATRLSGGRQVQPARETTRLLDSDAAAEVREALHDLELAFKRDSASMM
jgi:hypothetical protein